MPPRVLVRLVRQLADLHAWGRWEGSWWGLVSWRTYGSFGDGVNGYLHTSAWVPARLLDPSSDPNAAWEYQTVQRFDLPEDRAGQAAFLDLGITENASAADPGRFRNGPMLALAAERAAARETIKQFGVRAPSIGDRIDSTGDLLDGNSRRH